MNRSTTTSVGLFLLLLWGCASPTRPVDAMARGIWVTRFDWTTAEDVARVIGQCADAGFTTVMFQVRGNGTVFYDSRIEPWSERFGYRSPGFDPLQVAVTTARARGIQLHAWVNVLPGWQGDKAPEDARQLLRLRPQWFLMDQDGQPEPLQKGAYVCLNPALPEVRDHLASLCKEIAMRYPVHGIHLDRIRFMDHESGGGGDRKYPLDARSRALCRVALGRDPLWDDVALARFRTESVTATVRAIRSALVDVGRPVVLSAAVMADPERALSLSNQDWPGWSGEGLIDALLPMNYTEDDRLFELRTAMAVARSRVPVFVGVGAYKHATVTQTRAQIEAVRRQRGDGFAVYAFHRLFVEPGVDPGFRTLLKGSVAAAR